MKKLVFDLPTYVESSIEKIGLEDTVYQLKDLDWMYECHGKTNEETKWSINNDWCKEVEVEEPHKFKIGDEIVCISPNDEIFKLGQIVTIRDYDGDCIRGRGYGSIYAFVIPFDEEYRWVKVIR